MIDFVILGGKRQTIFRKTFLNPSHIIYFFFSDPFVEPIKLETSVRFRVFTNIMKHSLESLG